MMITPISILQIAGLAFGGPVCVLMVLVLEVLMAYNLTVESYTVAMLLSANSHVILMLNSIIKRLNA